MNMLWNTDDEMNRYDEADLLAGITSPEMISDAKSVFNTNTGQTDLLAPLPSGGFVKLASQAPEIMVESPTMPGMVEPLPVEGPLARAAERTAAESQSKRRPMQLSPNTSTGQTSFFDNATSEIGKGLIRGGIVEPANFLKDNFGLYDPLVVQLVDPVTGEFDFDIKILSREEKADLDARMAAGEMPYAISLDELVASDETAGLGSQAIGGMAQFVGAFAGLGKLFRVGQGFKAGMTQGAAADFLGFDGSDAGITDLLLGFGVPDAMLPDFLEKDPTDPDYIGRLQASFEGAFIGGAIEKLIPLVGKVFRSIKDGDVPAEVVTQSISDGKEAMRQALVSAGENAQTRITERGTGTTMMSGVDPTAITDPLVAAAGRAVDDGFVAKVKPPTDDTPGIIAFHGSAADFDGFKLEKIGTGEGAQAYGYGLYFADKEDIAKYYRDFLSKSIDVDGKPFIRGNNIFDDVLGGDQDLADNLGATQGDLEKAIKEAKESRQEMLDFGNENSADIYADEVYKLEQLRGRVTDNSSKGHMYKVGLTPKPEDMLDYDKPLSEQPESVQTAFKSVFYNNFIKGDGDLEALFASPNDLSMQDMGLFDRSKGSQAYAELADKLGKTIRPVPLSANGTMMPTEAIASQALFEAGIPGIKYLDNASRSQQFVLKLDVRGKPYETEPIYASNLDDAKRIEADYKEKGFGVQINDNSASNYVIFDDSMIKILEKYGIVGPVAISAMALGEDET